MTDSGIIQVRKIDINKIKKVLDDEIRVEYSTDQLKMANSYIGELEHKLFLINDYLSDILDNIDYLFD